MAAFVSLAAAVPGVEAVASATGDLAAELRAALTTAGVVAGIDEPRLLELAERARDPLFEQPELLLAVGAAPRDGSPGSLTLAFEAGLAPGRLSEDGHMNFFERGLLKPVVAEQQVGTLLPPGAGQDGFCVDGRVLPARAGAAVKLALGPGVALDADGRVRARRDGVVLYKAGEQLDVVAHHVHQGVVDLHSGNLEMNGSLLVKGDVERLLQVRVSGDLEVLGAVGGGSLRAGGSIRVSGNVRGGDAARVIAEHDATLKSCENAEVTAGGALRVQEAVNSQLQARQIIVTGRLRGGSALAETSLSVKEAGTPSGSATQLQAGEALQLPDLAEVQRAVVMQKLRRMAERGGVREVVGARARVKGGKAGRAELARSAEELQALAARAELRAELERRAVVELGLGHPGVQVRIGKARLDLSEATRSMRYALDPESGQLRAERTVG